MKKRRLEEIVQVTIAEAPKPAVQIRFKFVHASGIKISQTGIHPRGRWRPDRRELEDFLLAAVETEYRPRLGRVKYAMLEVEEIR